MRILTWNIERLGRTKLGVPDMTLNLCRIIFDTRADIVVLLELVESTSHEVMNALSLELNRLARVAAPQSDDYTVWTTSHPTGGEKYGFIVRDPSVIQPVVVGPKASVGAMDAPLTNLDTVPFVTMPAPPAAPIRMPLIDGYVGRDLERGAAKKLRFSGRSLGDGGYREGRGFRMPCLAMFEVIGTPRTLLPIVVCHLAAVRSGRDFLAEGQMKRFKEFHIAQKFVNAFGSTLGGYIILNGSRVAVRDLIFTGDFNLDFLRQSPPLPAGTLEVANRGAFQTLTPTTTDGGSRTPAAQPGALNPLGGQVFNEPVPPNVIANLALKAAITGTGTILRIPNDPAVNGNNVTRNDLRGACFDNFFFGGETIGPINNINFPPGGPPPPPDAGTVIDVPGLIDNPLRVDEIHNHYVQLGKHDARKAPRPPGPPIGPLGPLTELDRLIRARYLSDHLPIMISFNLP